MHNRTLFLILTVTAVSLASAGISCLRWRKQVREKDLRLAQAARERDRFARELERIRFEKQMLERMLETKAASARPDAAPKTNDNS